MKPPRLLQRRDSRVVRPHAGARIETLRGGRVCRSRAQFVPTRGRGLKPRNMLRWSVEQVVRPHAGARIETTR